MGIIHRIIQTEQDVLRICPKIVDDRKTPGKGFGSQIKRPNRLIIFHSKPVSSVHKKNYTPGTSPEVKVKYHQSLIIHSGLFYIRLYVSVIYANNSAP
jgi:hypothetical protein